MNNHLTDDLIQTFTDSSEAALTADQKRHLQSCSECQKVAAQYRFLARRMNDALRVDLSHDLAERITSKVLAEAMSQPAPAPGASSRLAQWGLAVATAVSAVIAWGIAVGWEQMWATFGDGFLTGYDLVRSSFGEIWSSKEALGDHGDLVIAAIILLVLFGALDGILKATRKAQHSVFSAI